MWDGVANLRALSEYERALLAGDPETPAEAIRELSSDNSLMVASSIAGNWSASTGDLKVVLAHHPELCEFVAANPNAPLGVIEDSPIGSLGSSVLQLIWTGSLRPPSSGRESTLPLLLRRCRVVLGCARFWGFTHESSRIRHFRRSAVR